MSEDIQPQEAGIQANSPMPGPGFIADAEQFPSDAFQDKDHAGGESSAGGARDSRQPGEACIPNSNFPHAENGSVESSVLHDSDPTEVELVAKLDALLVKDVELSARYGVLLRSHRKTARERRTIRAELRQLHTEEGAILLEVKLHRARKGRGGGWAEFLRQRKPKRLSRTTADRWIKWYLDSKKQEQSQSEAPPGQASGNAPQDESGAFSGGDAESQPSSTAQPPVATDQLAANGFTTFEDLQQVIVLLKKSKAAHFKAAAEYAVTKLGFVTSHEAIYVTFTEAIATRGFVYPTLVEEGDTTNVSKGVNPGTEAPAPGSKAA